MPRYPKLTPGTRVAVTCWSFETNGQRTRLGTLLRYEGQRPIIRMEDNGQEFPSTPNNCQAVDVHGQRIW